MLDDWTKFVDDKKTVDVIYFDFQKAFDTVPHKKLIWKLYSYGIRGRLLNWIENFLKDRKQRVLLDGQKSNWSDVTSEIPQGSVLGPILFLIYINDLPEVVKSFIRLFADDTKIYTTLEQEESCSNLQEDINSMIKWTSTWLLKFNEKKCKHLQLGHPNQESSY